MRLHKLALAGAMAGALCWSAGAAQAQETAAEFFSAVFNQGPFSGRPQQSAIPRQVVQFTGRYAPGTIVISTRERRLYFVMGDGARSNMAWA